jgi:hypothetical protein
VVLPKATAACISQTSLKIKLRDPKYDPLKEVLVKINGKKVALVKGVKSLKKSVTLKKLPSVIYKIGVVATTVISQPEIETGQNVTQALRMDATDEQLDDLVLESVAQAIDDNAKSLEYKRSLVALAIMLIGLSFALVGIAQLLPST